VGIEDRLRRLEATNPDLCEQRPCQEPVAMTQKRLMPDGTVEVSGEPPPPLCDACPERDNPKAPIRHVNSEARFSTRTRRLAGRGPRKRNQRRHRRTQGRLR